MPSLSTEDYRYFENRIYLPMLITVLERDLELFEKLPFKLNRPYIALIEKALNIIRTDLKKTDIYITRHNMRLVCEQTTKESTDYAFIYAGYEERKRYTSAELRSKTEELMCEYLTK